MRSRRFAIGELDTIQLRAALCRKQSTSTRARSTTSDWAGSSRSLGLRTQELEGSYLGRARAVYLHRTGALPIFGNTYYLGGSLEMGNVWQERSAISLGDTIKRGSLFVAADTPFGPFYVAWGHTTRGDSTWYLLLGRP
jgi:NTE family protein